MRILTVCTSTQVFGAEVITLKLLEGFKRAGHDQLAVTSIWTDGEFNRRLAALEVREVRLPFGFFSKRLTFRSLRWTANFASRLPWLWLQWLRTVRRFQPDVILLTSSRLALPILPLLGAVPTFLIEHSNLDPTRTRRVIYPWLAKHVTGFVAVSRSTGDHLPQLGVQPQKIHVIRNGPFSAADREHIVASGTARLSANNPDFSVGIVGQIAPSKGHDDLVEVARMLHDQGLPLTVRVFGSGDPDYIARLSDRVARYGLGEIWRWMGYECSRASIFNTFDVCVMPSTSEAFGMVAAEAAAFGLPVIATSVGGLSEVVLAGETGFLIPPGDPAQLASKIAWLAKHPDAARAMGARGRQHVFSTFTQERMVSQFEELFGCRDSERQD